MIVTLLIALALAVILALLGLVAFAAWTARRVETAVPPIGRFITVDGIELHYVDSGSGPVILLLHGLASQLQTFTYAQNERLRGYRLVCLDRPGAGYSQAGPTASFEVQAALVAAFLTALDVERAFVVGHSLGGGVALALCLDHPAKVAGLALLAPATQGQEAAPHALRALAIRSDLIRWLVGWTFAAPATFRNRTKTLDAIFGPNEVAADFGTRAGALLGLRPWTFRAASRDLVAAYDSLPAYAARYREIRVPVGVLFGSGDRILDPRLHGETLRGEIADLVLETVEAAGHMLPISVPELTAPFIERMAAKAGFVREPA